MKAKNDSSEFDGVLASVSPELVRNYESMNLPVGTTLAQVNEEYKKTDKDPWAQSQFFVIVFMIVMFAVSALSGYFISKRLFLGGLLLYLFSGVLGCWWLLIPERRKALRAVENIHRLKQILMTFRESVKLLNQTGRTMRMVSKDAVRGELVCIAVWILDAEKKFDQVRMDERRDIFQIMHLGNYIQTNQEKLRETLEGAKRFGLEFNKTEIFADARRHLERMP
jgi:hypothetical protein